MPDMLHSPRLGLATWPLASLSVVTSWLVCALLLPVPTLGLAAAAGIAARLAYSLAVVLRRDHTSRRSHAEAVRIVGRDDPALGVIVVDSEVPAVYCLAGRPHTIVVTSGARDALASDQMQAVLAHERAHLDGRHHLLQVLARTLAHAFPGVALFGDAARQTVRLAEVHADDVAARRHGRRTVAEALVRVAYARTPVGALAAGGAEVLPRVQRLLANPARTTARYRLQWATGMLLVAAGPLAVAFLSATAWAHDAGLCAVVV
jgi:Zn-dependent protease with chaperone function